MVRLLMLLLGALSLSVVRAARYTQPLVVPRPFGERRYGRIIIGRNPGGLVTGPSQYMTSRVGLVDSSRQILRYFIRSHVFPRITDETSAFEHCRYEYGVPLLASCVCQAAIQVHNSEYCMGSERYFSCSTPQMCDRLTIYGFLREKARKRGGGLVSDVALALADTAFLTLSDAHVFGPRGDPYRHGGLVLAEPMTAVMFFMGLAMGDRQSLAQAQRYASEREWGPMEIPSCLYGALGWAVFLDKWEDRFIFNRDAYNAAAGRLQRQFHREVGVFTATISVVMPLLARHGGKFAVRIMENTLDDNMNRVLTPFMFGSMTIPTIVDMDVSDSSVGLRKRAQGQPYSRENDWFRTVYGSNLYLLASKHVIDATSSTQAVAGGIWDERYRTRPRRPEGRWGRHAQAMRHLLRLFGARAVHHVIQTFEEEHPLLWLSLNFGMAFQMVWYFRKSSFTSVEWVAIETVLNPLNATSRCLTINWDGDTVIVTVTPYPGISVIAMGWTVPTTRADIEGPVDEGPENVDLDEEASRFNRNFPFACSDDEDEPAGPGSYLRGQIRAEDGDEKGPNNPDDR